jgi:cytochrome c biogenesis protein CcdA
MKDRQEDIEVASPTYGSGGTDVPPVLPSIPLSEESSRNGGESIGGLVGEATRHIETMIKGQLELAKAELKTEAKKGLQGSVFFVIALAILAFSLFFPFIALAEGLTEWLQRWAAYLVVFGIMLVAAGLAAFIGFLRVKRIRAPERTISSVRGTKDVLTRRGRSDAAALER